MFNNLVRFVQETISSTSMWVAICIFIAIVSVLVSGGDNPIEEIANDVINETLGTDVDISDIMTSDSMFKEPSTP